MKLLLLLCLVFACAAAAVATPTKSATNSLTVVTDDKLVEVSTDKLTPFNDDLEKAKLGLQAGRDLFEIFNSDIFQKSSVKQISEIVSKVLGLTISIINLVQGLGPQESAEMQLMRQQFKIINAKLDGLSLQLDEVKLLIEWRTTRVMYAQYESFIVATTLMLNNFMTAPESDREVLKRQFLTAYPSNRLATLKLYQAIVETDFVVAQNLAKAVVQYTGNHRRQTMNFLLAMQRLIMRGAQLEIAYEKMMHGDHAAAVTKGDWDERMEKLLSRMQQVEIGVKNSYHGQLAIDVNKFNLNNKDVNNRDFSSMMYQFVASKYDWRAWLSLAYDDVSGYSRHSLSYCFGFVQLRTHDRNVAVISTDPKTSGFSSSLANQLLDVAERHGSGGSNADYWTTLFRNSVYDSCYSASFVGSICWGCGVYFTVRSDRYAYKRIVNRGGSINAILFG